MPTTNGLQRAHATSTIASINISTSNNNNSKRQQQQKWYWALVTRYYPGTYTHII